MPKKKVIKLVKPKPSANCMKVLNSMLAAAKTGEVQAVGIIAIKKGRVISSIWDYDGNFHMNDMIMAFKQMERRLLEEGYS